MPDAEAPSAAPTGRTVPGSNLGWIGVLTGPVAWIVQLVVSWIFGEVVACAPANTSPGEIGGIHLNALLAVVNGILLLITILAGVGSLLELRGIRSRSDPTPGGRATWLATAGVMSSVLFAVLIATSFVPLALIGGCG